MTCTIWKGADRHLRLRWIMFRRHRGCLESRSRCGVLRCAVLHCLCCVALSYVALQNLRYAMLCCIVLCCVVLCCAILSYLIVSCRIRFTQQFFRLCIYLQTDAKGYGEFPLLNEMALPRQKSVSSPPPSRRPTFCPDGCSASSPKKAASKAVESAISRCFRKYASEW